MMRRSLAYKWTEEDRLTRARWGCGIGIFYGCIAFLLFGVMAIGGPWAAAPDRSTDFRRGPLSGARAIAPPACAEKRHESCSGKLSGEQGP